MPMGRPSPTSTGLSQLTDRGVARTDGVCRVLTEGMEGGGTIQGPVAGAYGNGRPFLPLCLLDPHWLH